MLAEVQVFEGDGIRRAKPRSPKPLAPSAWQGRVSFRVDDFPVHFDYRVEEIRQDKTVVGQNIAFDGAGTMFYASSYTHAGEPRPKHSGYTDENRNNYMVITWDLTKQVLIDIFMSRAGDAVRARVAHARKFGKKRLT